MACQERIQNYAMRQALHPNEQNKEVSHEANVNVKVPVRNEVDSGSNDNDDDDDDATEADDNFDASGSVLPFGKIKRNGTFVPQPPQFNPSPSSNAFDVADDQSVGAASLASNSVASLANDSLASSTFGDDRQFVRSKTLSDKHGDQGKYWGVILKSSGLPHGMGRIAYDGGWSYDGSWCHGWWHGRGIAHFVEGDSYAGEYRFNQRHGHGCYRWADGRVYDGEFNNEHRHGQGTYTFPDGDCYRGEFKNGQREGHGTNTFSDGGFYTGSWVTGRHEGFGGTCAVEFCQCDVILKIDHAIHRNLLSFSDSSFSVLQNAIGRMDGYTRANGELVCSTAEVWKPMRMDASVTMECGLRVNPSEFLRRRKQGHSVWRVTGLLHGGNTCCSATEDGC
jgi:hypothetical protein